jgi:hypothetical protein
MMEAYSKKKNKILKLTPAEVEQNLSAQTQGAGFFKTLHKLGVSRKQFMKGTKEVAKVAAPIVKEVAKPVGSMIGMAGATALGNPELAPIAGVIGAKLADEGANQLTKFAGSGLKQDIVHPFKTIINKITGGSVHNVKYDTEMGFKPTVGHHSKLLKGSGMDSKSEVHNHSIYQNGYGNRRMPLGHQTYTPFIQRADVYVNPVKEGGSFLPSGY